MMLSRIPQLVRTLGQARASAITGSLSTFAALSLGACATSGINDLDLYPSDHLQFSPAVATVEVEFIVLDRRRPEDKRFRESAEAKHTYLYGDSQFFPLLVRVAATHFADAFPRDVHTTELIIRQFDVIDKVPRPLGDPDVQDVAASELAAPFVAPFVLAYAAAHPGHNTITCHLLGSYDGVSFDEEVSVEYKDVRSRQHAEAVTAAILAAVTKAIHVVRNSRSSRNVLPRK